MLVELPEEARILCVGSGTGNETLYLGSRRPGWLFTAVEPSAAMIEACRQAISAAGYSERCSFHTGYTEDLPGFPGRTEDASHIRPVGCQVSLHFPAGSCQRRKISSKYNGILMAA